MDYPSAELVRLMREFVTHFQADYPILFPDRERLSSDMLLQRLHALFAPYFGEARVTASLAVPLDYLAYLMVIEGTLTNSLRSRAFGGQGWLLEGTKADITRFGDPPPPPDTVETWQAEDGREINLPHSGATVQLDQRHIWLSIGEEGERTGVYLCGDRQSDHYGWVVLEDDDHPWFRHTFYGEHRSFLTYLRRIVPHDTHLVHLLEQMETHVPPPK
jgi:hypothetical protein